MKNLLAYILLLLAAALGCGAVFSLRSVKIIARPVGFLLLALIPPVLGNALIIFAFNEILSTVGYYVYFLGMDLVVYALLLFTLQYCMIPEQNPRFRLAVQILLGIDVVQMLLNLLFGHAFTTALIEVRGSDYYQLIPYLGQSFHRIVCYGVFFVALGIFLMKMIRAPRIYMERYAVIFLTMTVVGIWESFYIFSGTPIDRSMIGFGVFGLLVFYFALFYRPQRLLDRMLSQVASGMDEAYFFFDAMERPIWANEAGLKMIGADSGNYESINELLNLLFGRIYLGMGRWKEQRVLEYGGEKRYYSLEKQTMEDRRHQQAGSFLIVRDRTEEHRNRLMDQYYAVHDRLTGLYNKEYLFEQIRQELLSHPDRKYLVMLVDVSNFKMVNDIFGNSFGDRALQQIAETIRQSVGDLGLYGRISGDVFGICVEKSTFVPSYVEEILHHSTVSDGRISYHLVVHMGIYETEEADLDVSLMFDRAQMALSQVKDNYSSMLGYYSKQMREEALWDQYISAELARGIERREICPYLQPIVNSDGVPVGAEVLVRWNHPEQGFLSPGRFVPVFEKNGMIAEMDRYMWRCACEILAEWKKQGLNLFLSVNVSPKDFFLMDVEKEIRSIVAEFGINPGQLRVEITETVMMTDMENRIRILNSLKEDGFLIEMDDFGSGYSSLNMLKDMPIELIKIDMLFLKKAGDDGKSRTILQNILRLSEELGMMSLTEGVETETQYRMLANRGCSLFQGFYFARPMPLEEFEAYRKKISGEADSEHPGEE